MRSFSVPQEPIEMKDWGVSQPSLLGVVVQVVHSATLKGSIYIVFVINDAPWSCVIYNMHGHS